MKTALVSVALFFASHVCNSQQFLETTFGSWDNQNLSVETFQDFVISGYTETNPGTGLLTPTFKITDIFGNPLNTFYTEYYDDMYLMDFTIRESTHTIILTGMTAVTTGGTPYKMFVAEVDFMSGAPVQSWIEYTYNGNSMVPHQVIASEISGQVMVVGTEITGTVTPGNFGFIQKSGFILALDINNFSNILYTPLEMDVPAVSNWDYDMLENITEVDGFGYFISGSCNGPTGEQNLLVMTITYGGGIAASNIIDNTNSRFAGASVMYNQQLNVVYVLVNNSIMHQYQVAQFNPFTATPSSPWVNHQFTAFPIGSGVDQNGFRLQQTPDNLIIVGGYLSAPFGALPEQLTPFQTVMKDNLTFIAAKLYVSGNNSPLSPSYFEENGNSVFINTPDMIVYNEVSKRTYLVNQNINNGGFDLDVSSLFQPSQCEKALKVATSMITPVIVGSGNYNLLPMYPKNYMPNPTPRPIMHQVLCPDVSPAIVAHTPDATLAPNPATIQLSITLDEGETIQHASVYDLKGNVVLSQQATDRPNHILTLNVEKLSPGTYVVEITTKEGTIRHEKFVKQ